LDIAQVENMFATPRAFNYYMNRKTSEEWMREQEKDKDQVHPVTLELIESKVHLTSVKDMLVFEGGRSDYKRKSDIELCVEIDMLVRELFQKSSIYTLTDEEKHTIARVVRGKYFASTAQLSRCLAIRR
jgi:hypothetical protein